jgi:hypothetical protein
MKINRLQLCCLSLLLCVVPSLSQESQPVCASGPEVTFREDLLDKLAGKWSLTGDMMGRELHQECVGEWSSTTNSLGSIAGKQEPRLCLEFARNPPCTSAAAAPSTVMPSTWWRYLVQEKRLAMAAELETLP